MAEYAVILDFEATCDDVAPPRPQEIVELPSVLVRLADRAVLDEFQTFVRPVHHPALTPFCTGLTGISQADVDPAPAFPEAFAAHGAWLRGHGLHGGNALLVTCGDWDLKTMLPGQLRASGLGPPDPLYRRWCNLKIPFARAVGGKRVGMTGMLAALGLPLVGRHHRGIDDCRNLASILVELLNRGAAIEVTGSLP